MKNKQKYLNMRDTVNRHLKAEWAAISSMEMGNMLEILYGDRGKADEKAKSIKNKSYGTGVHIRVEAAQSAVLVRKV